MISTALTIRDYCLIFLAHHKFFSLTLIFHTSLYLTSSNKAILLVTLIYLTLSYIVTKNLKQSLFLCFVITLPFAKGKSLEIFLLDKTDAVFGSVFNISYFFNIYLSTAILSLYIWFYLSHHHQFLPISKELQLPALIFSGFIVYSLVSQLDNTFFPVIALSALELTKLLIIFALPCTLSLNHRYLYQTFSSSVIFQSFWVLLQSLHGGRLGKFIEASLPGEAAGVISVENTDLFRSTGTFFEPSILGTFLLTHLVLFATLLLTKRRLSSFDRKLYLLTVMISAIATIFTGSRGIYLLSAVIFLAYFYFFRRRLKQASAKLVSNIPARLILLSGFSIFIFVTPFLFARLQSSGTLFAPSGSGTYRLQLISRSLTISLDKITGVGLNLSPYHFATNPPRGVDFFNPAHPHNIFFQILIETGFVGLCLFALFIYVIFRSYTHGHSSQNLPFAASALAFLLSAQIYPIFLNHPEILSYLFLYLGFMLSPTNHHDT